MATNDEWEDVTAQHLGTQDNGDWEDVTAQHLDPVYTSPAGPDKPEHFAGIKPRSEFNSREDYIKSKLYSPEQINESLKSTAMLMAGNAPGVAANAATRIGSNALIGAATNPEDRLKGAAVGTAGGVFGEGLNIVGKGLGKAADYTMQKAANIKKQLPGLGTELIKNKVWGTKGMMADQIADRIPTQGQKLTEAVGELTDNIDPTPVIQRLEESANKLKIGEDIVPGAEGMYNKYNDLANYLRSKGSMSPTDLLKFKQIQGDIAHTVAGNPAASDVAQAAKVAMGESGDALKGAYASQFPGQANKIADTNKTLTALYRAKKGVSTSDPLAEYLMKGGLSAVGMIAGGAPAALAAPALRSTLAKSTGAYGLFGLGKAAEMATPAVAPVTTIFGNRNK